MDARPSPFATLVLGPLDFLGRKVIHCIDQTGASVLLFFEVCRWIVRSFTRRKVRIGRPAIVTQLMRIGVRSIFIVSLVSGCVGLILALQLAPPLDEFGQKDSVANIIGVATLRELGPLMAAIVLTGFAGASIAAEIGTMVVSEEIEALEAHALNPIRFLVVPRVIAGVLSMLVLGIIADLVAVFCALAISMVVLDIPYANFMQNMLNQVSGVDFQTGIVKSGIFGLLIGVIACVNGLKVSGGAAGVGRATTFTVVECIVAIIIADLVFTAIFYALDLV